MIETNKRIKFGRKNDKIFGYTYFITCRRETDQGILCKQEKKQLYTNRATERWLTCMNSNESKNEKKKSNWIRRGKWKHVQNSFSMSALQWRQYTHLNLFNVLCFILFTINNCTAALNIRYTVWRYAMEDIRHMTWW